MSFLNYNEKEITEIIESRLKKQLDKIEDRENNTDCITWNDEKENPKSTYGVLRLIKNETQVYFYYHRLIYFYFHGSIPNKLVVRHMCNKKNCINPDHLALGSQYDNVLDRFSFNTWGSKLTNEQAQEIKELISKEPTIENKKYLAHKFGVSKATIQDILTGRCWSILNKKQ